MRSKQMSNKQHITRVSLLTICLLSVGILQAEELRYRMDVGVQGGVNYYVGDGVKHIFTYPRPAAGAQLRYKFTSRWALQLKGMWSQIAFPNYDTDGVKFTDKRNMGNLDIVAEFNFFRFGTKQYDERVKPITPYIFLGIGASLYNDGKQVGAYIPLGFGLKWKFAKHCGLNVMWQHQIFLTDELEGVGHYGNTYNLNGSNIINNDVTGMLTVGIVFEFMKQRAVCPLCEP